MRRITTANRAIDLFGVGKHGFRNGDLPNGISATNFNADWTNQVQEELANVIESAGLPLDGTMQLQNALPALGGFRAAATNAALRATAGTTAYAVATLCRAVAGDGGQGMWSWDSGSVAADDDLLMVMPTGQVGAGRWVRMADKVDARWFGVKPNQAGNMTAALSTALAFAAVIGGELYIPAGTYNTSNLTWSFALDVAGKKKLSVVANGVVLNGIDANPTWILQYTKGLIIHGLQVNRHASAPAGAVLNSVWRSQFYGCAFEDVKLTAVHGWGTYWNEFYSCLMYPTLQFDLTLTSINANQWFGGTVGTISKTAALGIYKEAYGNVFHGVDVLGAPAWFPDTIKDPLTFADCSFEFSGTSSGYIVKRGGHDYTPSGSARPWDCVYGEHQSQRGGAGMSTGWSPNNSTNLIRGGACQSRGSNIQARGVADAYLNTALEVSSPTGNGYCWQLSFAPAGYAALEISLPQEYMAEARACGAVTFGVWLYCLSHVPPVIINNTGVSPSGDQYPPSDLTTGVWLKRFWTVPVLPSDTQSTLKIGGSLVSGFNVLFANITCHLGRTAYPYSPAPGEPSAKRAITFRKTFIADGVAATAFTLPMPSTNSVRRIKVSARCNNNDTVSYGEGTFLVLRHQTSGNFLGSIMGAAYGASSYGAGTSGGISAFGASTSGGISSTLTISSYGGSPARIVDYELEYLDNDEQVTW